MSDDEWEYEEYEDDGDEEWEEDVDGPLADGDLSRTLPFGFVSMLPLFVAYEIVQGASTRPPRAARADESIRFSHMSPMPSKDFSSASSSPVERRSCSRLYLREVRLCSSLRTGHTDAAATTWMV